VVGIAGPRAGGEEKASSRGSRASGERRPLRRGRYYIGFIAKSALWIAESRLTALGGANKAGFATLASVQTITSRDEKKNEHGQGKWEK
jgi:hypothetical protein